MSRKLPDLGYVTRAEGRAKRRGWWGFICALLTCVIAFFAWTCIVLALLDWHDELHHPERLGVVLPKGRPIELWSITAFATVVPCLAGAGLLLNTIIWLIPPLRARSERPARLDPSLSFIPMQGGLAKLALWSAWTIPLAVVATWLAP